MIESLTQALALCRALDMIREEKRERRRTFRILRSNQSLRSRT
jgi:hypothetical protein